MPLNASGARRFYDRLGRFQDTQRFYEDPAVRRMIELGRFDRSRAVYELGCGTGRLAADLLTDWLAPTARYVAVDVSPTMTRLADQCLSAWSSRASVHLLEPPATTLPGDDGAFDRFVSTYVFDLLAPDHARALIAEAARLLAPGGLLALVSLTHGTTRASRAVCSAWDAVASRWPSLVGGCRPIELRDLIDSAPWRLRQAQVIVRFGVASEVVVASRT